MVEASLTHILQDAILQDEALTSYEFCTLPNTIETQLTKIDALNHETAIRITLIARIWGLTIKTVSSILDFVSKNASKGVAPQKILINRKLCEAVKYAILRSIEYFDSNGENNARNWVTIARKIVEILKMNNLEDWDLILIPILKSIIPYLSTERNELLNDIKKNLNNPEKNWTSNKKQYMQELLEQTDTDNRTIEGMEDDGVRFRLDRDDIATYGLRFGRTTYVAMTQNQHMSTAINYNSEKKELQFLNLCDSFAQRKKELLKELPTDVETIPEAATMSPGSDKSLFKNTRQEVARFLEFVNNGGKLKEDDYNYLCDKLLGRHFVLHGIEVITLVYAFPLTKNFVRFVDVDIAIVTILNKLSCKKHRLPTPVMDKLFGIVKPIETFLELRTNFNLSRTYVGISNSTLSRLQLLAIQTILQESQYNRNVLTKERCKILHEYKKIPEDIVTECRRKSPIFLRSFQTDELSWAKQTNASEAEIKLVINEILSLHQTTENNQVRFDNALSTLFDDNMTDTQINMSCATLEEAVYLVEPGSEGSFNSDVKNQLVQLIAKETTNEAIRVGCTRVLSTYLAQVSGASLQMHLVNDILNSIVEATKPCPLAFGVLYQSVRAQKNAPLQKDYEDILEITTYTLLGTLGSKTSNTDWDDYAVVTLFLLLEHEPSFTPPPSFSTTATSWITKILVQIVSSKFFYVNEDSKVINFLTSPKENSVTVSSCASQLLLGILKKISATVTSNDASFITDLIMAPLITSPCMQTQIRLSEIVYELRNGYAQSTDSNKLHDNLEALMKLCNKSTTATDIRLYCTAVSIPWTLRYIQICREDEINKTIVEKAIRCFNFDGMALDHDPESNDISVQMNIDIMELIYECVLRKFLPNETFAICDIVLKREFTPQPYLERILRILFVISNSNKLALPGATLSNLDAVFQTEDPALLTIVLQIISSCISNGQIIGEIPLNYAAEKLYQDGVEKSISFTILENAFLNQELNPEMFATFMKELTLREISRDTNPPTLILGRIALLRHFVTTGGGSIYQLTCKNLLCLQDCLSLALNHRDNSLFFSSSLQIQTLQLLTSAAENGQVISQSEELIHNIIIRGLMLQTPFDLEVLHEISLFFLVLQKTNRTIHNCADLRENIESILPHVNRTYTLFRNLFRILAAISSKERSTGANCHVTKDILSLAIETVRNVPVGEVSLNELLPLICEELKHFPRDMKDNDIFIELSDFYCALLDNFDMKTHEDLLSVKCVLEGIKNLDDKLGDNLLKLVKKFITLAQLLHDPFIATEISKYIKCNQSILPNLELNSSEKLDEISQTMNLVRSIQIIKAELDKKSNLNLNALARAVHYVTQSENVSQICQQDCTGGCDSCTRFNNINKVMNSAHTLVSNSWKLTNISRDVIGYAISLLDTKCAVNCDITIICIIQKYADILVEEKLHLTNHQMKILMKYFINLAENTDTKVQYLEFLKELKAQEKFEFDKCFIRALAKHLQNQSRSEENELDPVELLQELNKFVIDSNTNKKMVATHEDINRYCAAAETMITSGKGDAFSLKFATALSLYVVRYNASIQLQIDQNWKSKFSRFMIQIAKIHNPSINQFQILGLIKALDFISHEPEDNVIEKQDLSSLFNIIHHLQNNFTMEACKFQFVMECLQVCKTEEDFNLLPQNEIITILNQGMNSSVPLAKFTIYNGFWTILNQNAPQVVQEFIRSITEPNNLQILKTSALFPEGYQGPMNKEVLIAYIPDEKQAHQVHQIIRTYWPSTLSEEDKETILSQLVASGLQNSIDVDDLIQIITAIKYLPISTVINHLTSNICPFPSNLAMNITFDAIDAKIPPECIKIAKKFLQSGIKFITLHHILSTLVNFGDPELPPNLRTLMDHLTKYNTDEVDEDVANIVAQNSAISPLNLLIELQAIQLSRQIASPTTDIFKNLFNKKFLNNSVLAQRDTGAAKKMFDMIQLSTDHNRDKGNYVQGFKQCYSADIVFGEGSQFQFDILRHEFGMLSTMERIPSVDNHINLKDNYCLLIDEVDAMFIDESTKFARLSCDLPGMDLLELIYHFIWKNLCLFKNRIVTLDSGGGAHPENEGLIKPKRVFVAFGKTTRHPSGIVTVEKRSVNQDGTINVDQEDIGRLIRNSGDYSNYAVEIKGNVPKFIEEILTHLTEKFVGLNRCELCSHAVEDEEALETLANFYNPSNSPMEIPTHLKPFVQQQISIWQKSALIAMFEYRQDVHYIVDSGLVKPVDVETSGMIRGNQNWGDGIQQFLQLKHNLAITVETLATNYMSTISFVQRFNPGRVFGFTGTFDPTSIGGFVKSVYKSENVTIPDPYYRNFHQFPDIVVESEEEWKLNILESVQLEVVKGRAVLLICRSIQKAAQIFRYLQSNSALLKYHSLKLYTKNHSGEERHVEGVVPKDIIIATILAGRGTDIKSCPALETNGGLHVCVTFLPLNSRAERQILGRTSRQGNYGTAQFIIYSKKNEPSSIHRPSQSNREYRNEAEASALQSFEKTQLPVIDKKEKNFRKMCNVLFNLRKQLKEHESWKRKIASKTPLITKFVGVNKFEKNILSSVEEQWAFVVKQVDRRLLSKFGTEIAMSAELEKEVDTIFSQFFSQLENLIAECKEQPDYVKLIRNPFYAVQIGNYWLQNNDSIKHLILPYYQHAITLDDTHASAAHVGLAACYISDEVKIFKSGKVDYKNMALHQINIALLQLTSQQALGSAAYLMFAEREKEAAGVEANTGQTALGRQLQRGWILIENYLAGVKNMKATIEESFRAIDLILHSESDYVEHVQVSRDEDDIDRILNQPHLKVDITLNHLTSSTELIKLKKDQVADVAKFVKETLPAVEMKENFRYVVNVQEPLTLVKMMRESNSEEDLTKNGCRKLLQGGDRWHHKVKSYVPFLRNSSPVIVSTSDEDVESNCLNAHQALRRIEADDDNPSRKYSLRFPNPNYELFDKVRYKIMCKSFVNFIKLIAHFRSNHSCEIAVKASGRLEVLQKLWNCLPTREMIKIFIVSADKKTTECKMISRPDEIQTALQSEQKINAIEFPVQSVEDNIFKILNTFNDAVFDVTFGGKQLISNHEAVQFLNLHGGTADIEMARFDKWEVFKSILTALRDNTNLEISLRFTSVSSEQADKIAKCGKIKSRPIKIMDINKLSSLYPAEFIPPELLQITGRGMELIILLNELPPFPIYSFSAVLALSALEVSFGLALICTGVGVPVGLAALSEGAVDLFKAGKILYSKEFDLPAYLIQKSISLALSGITLVASPTSGVAAQIGKEIKTQIGKEFKEQVGTAIIVKTTKTIATTAGSTLTTFQANGISALLRLAEVGARECLYMANIATTEFVTNSFGMEESISLSVSRDLTIRAKNRPPSSTQCHSLSAILDRIYILYDKSSTGISSHNLPSPVAMITSALKEILQSTESGWKLQLGAVGQALSQAIGSRGTLGQLGTFAGSLLCMSAAGSEMNCLLNNVCSHLEEVLQEFETKEFSLIKMIQHICLMDDGECLDLENCKAIARALIADLPQPVNLGARENREGWNFVDYIHHCAFLKVIASLDVVYLQQQTGLSHANIISVKGKLSKYCTEISSILQQTTEKSQSESFAESHSEIAQLIVASVTSEISQITKNYLINPILNHASNFIVTAASNAIQNRVFPNNNSKPEQSAKQDMSKTASGTNSVVAGGGSQTVQSAFGIGGTLASKLTKEIIQYQDYSTNNDSQKRRRERNNKARQQEQQRTFWEEHGPKIIIFLFLAVLMVLILSLLQVENRAVTKSVTYFTRMNNRYKDGDDEEDDRGLPSGD